MADLSFGVKGSTMDFTVSMQIADTDTPRILAYLAQSHYGTDAEGNPRAMEATVKAFAAGILQGLLDATTNAEREAAMRAAAATVQEIKPIEPAPVEAVEPTPVEAVEPMPVEAVEAVEAVPAEDL